MSTPFCLHIPQQLYHEMLAQARGEWPNECCGLLAGTVVTASGPGPAIGKVARRYPLVNSAASPVEFLSDPQSLFAAHRDMHRLGLDILAVYHSHPTSEPVPSRKDLEQNYSPDVMTLIISLHKAAPEVRGWWLTGESYREAEWLCPDASDER